MIKLTSLLLEQQGVEQLYYRLTESSRDQLIADVDKLNSGHSKPLQRGFQFSRRFVSAIFQSRQREVTKGTSGSPGADRILDILKIDRPVFCAWGDKPFFGSAHYVVPIGSFKTYQSDLIPDISTYGRREKYQETEVRGGLSRRQTGTYSDQEMELRAKEGADSYHITNNKLDYVQGGGTNETILDCHQTNKYWLISIKEWADSLRTTEMKLKQQVVDYNTLKQTLLETRTVAEDKYPNEI